MNTSKSGYLTAEELKEATTKFKSTIRKELGRDKGYELNWDKLVSCLDVDKDKKLGFDEFVTAATNRERLITGEGHLKDAFDILDVDKDGLISIDEFKQTFANGVMGSGMEKIQSVEEDQWDKLLKGIDKDGDGKINYHEFEAHMLQLVD